MFERLYTELFENDPEHRERPKFISVLAIYYFLNPFLYLYSISQDVVFLNFGVQDWKFALLYCGGAPLLGYLLWTLRFRVHVVLYAFLAFEILRGARHGYWDVVLLGIAALVYAVRGRVREAFGAHTRQAHR